MQVSIPRLTIIRKKSTGGITVIAVKLEPDMLSDEYEIVHDHPGDSSSRSGDDKFGDFAHILFLAGAEWARENPDKEIGED